MTTGLHPISRFGVFEVDRRTGELRKQGVRLRLPAQPFQVLTALLDRAGEVVTRDELQRQVWPADTFVDFDRGLNKAVNRLRETLGDSADSPRFIETLPKRGYRFIAPVQHVAAGPAAPDPGAGATAGRAQAARADTAPAAAPAALRASRERQRGVRLAAAAAALGAVAAVAYALHLGRPPGPGGPARIVFADFDNRTGDPAFDHTLAQALAVHLQQSPVVQVVSEHEVRRTLSLMRRPPDGPLPADVAHEVCRRADGLAVLGGSVSRLGSAYVLGLTAVDCRTGEALARQQVRAARKEDVLGALDAAAAHVRRVLGESHGSIQRFDMRVHRSLTTGSLAAFEAYTAGERNVLRQGGWSAVPFFRRAIEIDPEFAYAHAALGLVLGTVGEATRSRVHTEQAYRLRDRVSEWERLFITAQYHDRVTGELDKALSTCEMWAQTYPHDRTARNRLAAAYTQLGQPARAVAELERARQAGRDHPIDIDAWAAAAIRLNRAGEADPIVRRALEDSPDRLPLRRLAYRLAFAAGDEGAMAAHVEWAASTPRAETILAEHAATEAYVGRLDRARAWTDRAVAAAVRNDFTGNAGVWSGVHAVREALLGHAAEARAQARAAVAFEASWETRALAAVALARVGDVEEAQRLAAELHAERPRGTLVQHYWLPAIRALGELSAGRAAAAIEALEPAAAYERSDTRLPLLPAFLRGEAYLQAGDAARAAAEFRKLVDQHGLVANSVLGPCARLGLARALGRAGARAQAEAQYTELLRLWHRADPAMPLLTQARAEHAALAAR
jgi:DNA-binding winged helix-turn-helix (wHTH) protein/tetratricopeptide (TPR) repeat protein